jgi:hypothetical protein
LVLLNRVSVTSLGRADFDKSRASILAELLLLTMLDVMLFATGAILGHRDVHQT